jgi:hypothetical protein
MDFDPAEMKAIERPNETTWERYVSRMPRKETWGLVT